MKPTIADLTERLRAVRPDRRLFLDDNITSEQAVQMIRAIANMNKAGTEDILLQINSNGGNAVGGLQAYDALRFSRAPILGLVTGDCLSTALVLLQGCSLRFALEHSRFLFHHVANMVSVKLSPVSDVEAIKRSHEQEIAQLKLKQESFNKIFLERTKMKQADLEFFLQTETKILVPQALRYGLIDHVV